jgi:hypothetical protein
MDAKAPRAGHHDSGGRMEGGITISRRPNNRPSKENAPGPSRLIAMAQTIIAPATVLVSCRLHPGAGNQEAAMPAKQTATKTAAAGVRSPTASATPLTSRTPPSNQLSARATDTIANVKTPAAAAVKPRAVRSSKSPKPGRPPGKVENSLCSAYLPGALIINPLHLRVCGPTGPR